MIDGDPPAKKSKCACISIFDKSLISFEQIEQLAVKGSSNSKNSIRVTNNACNLYLNMAEYLKLSFLLLSSS